MSCDMCAVCLCVRVFVSGCVVDDLGSVLCYMARVATVLLDWSGAGIAPQLLLVLDPPEGKVL